MLQVIEPDSFDTEGNEDCVWDLGVRLRRSALQNNSVFYGFSRGGFYIGFTLQPIDFERRTPEMCCLELLLRSFLYFLMHMYVYLSTEELQ